MARAPERGARRALSRPSRSCSRARSPRRRSPSTIRTSSPRSRIRSISRVEHQLGVRPRARVAVPGRRARQHLQSDEHRSCRRSITNVQNIDRVRTRGVETAFSIDGVGIDTLRIEGSLAYASTRILRERQLSGCTSATSGRAFRTGAATCRRSGGRRRRGWRASAVRYSGRMFNRLENDDINPRHVWRRLALHVRGCARRLHDGERRRVRARRRQHHGRARVSVASVSGSHRRSSKRAGRSEAAR